MLRLVKFALPLALLTTLQPAHAQMGFGRQWETNVSLSQADIDMITATLAQKIHGQQVGTAASWSNSASGNSGTLTLLRIFGRKGQRCEQIDYRIRSSGEGSDRYDLVSCLQPDGSWKLSY